MKQNSVLIRGGQIVDPASGVDMVGDLLITDGLITWIDESGSASRTGVDMVIPAEGMVVSAGFIDLHCHLREPGFESKETIASGTRAGARGGFTTVCCMPNTRPAIDTAAMVEFVRKKAESEARVRVLPIACVTKGQLGEKLSDMYSLAAAGAVAFSDDGKPVAGSDLMRSALEVGLHLDLPIIDHCEDTFMTAGGVVNDGSVSVRLGLKGMPAMAEEVMVARDIELAKATGARVHFAHVSTAGSVELIRKAKRDQVNVTAEATPHHLTLTEERVNGYDTNAKVNPPLRTRKDVEELIRGLQEGVIDAIATDHAPHAAEDKAGHFASAAFGISGLETALAVMLALVHEGKLDLMTLVDRLTAGPARVLGRNSRSARIADGHPIPSGIGTLMVGGTGDVTVFDPGLDWEVDPDLFASKGRNNPWAGTVLTGKVMATLSRGTVAYCDESLMRGE